MFFDAKTKTFYGKLRMLTAEEEAELDRRVAKGELYSTKHPSQEEIEKLCRIREELGLNKELDDLMFQVTEEEIATFQFPPELLNFEGDEKKNNSQGV